MVSFRDTKVGLILTFSKFLAEEIGIMPSFYTALSFKIVFHFGEYYYFIASTHVFCPHFL